MVPQVSAHACIVCSKKGDKVTGILRTGIINIPMEIRQMATLYGKLPQYAAFLELLADEKVRTVALQGLVASSAPVFFASLFERMSRTVLFILNDPDEAG